MNTAQYQNSKRSGQVPCQIDPSRIKDMNTTCGTIGVGVICRDRITTTDGRTFVRTDMGPIGYSMRDESGNTKFCSFWNRGIQGSESK